ncbi:MULTISPECIES: PhoX family phosphatase [unclassified Sphingopyxis]|uniref:PhoX family protein n=1 Tax=unclassified Sphingopyxis TaxID=2614943 RepID=UPI002866C6A1|nr:MULTISPECIES: PhoX family phosphatase [unclassified Sphingopyxis]MDR6831897.1 secreted PhoX family phosphatase [Sphingopyxis sp. BE122]MDR7227639.1 secreted PhoX family phosphatase [Sphingopyxis sp. BE259]
MSHLTDDARAPYRGDTISDHAPGSLEAIVAANPTRRTLLRNGLFGLSMLSTTALAACGGTSGDPVVTLPPTAGPRPTPTPTAPPVSYAVTFAAVAANQNDAVTVPAGYTVDVLLKAGDSVESGAAYTGSFPTPAIAEKWAGGNHDGMEYFAFPGVDANNRGLLAINHEYPDFNILMSGNYNAATATADQKAVALSAVGISVVEIAKGSDGKWSVQSGSTYNRRYTGNSSYRVGGPAAGVVAGPIKGMLNNCASGRTPWGTYLTCEETTDNYLDPTQPANGYGWVIEIDPRRELAQPTKRTAMGRFDHENVAFLENSDRRTAFYMGDDATPGCIYKFVPDRAYSATNRAANTDLLDSGTLYVARFNGDGTGEWRALVVGQNGLAAGASDPGNTSQSTTPPAPTIVNFNSQADVLINCKSAARVAGGTVMDRPEWITVAPDNSAVFVTLTNNSGRRVTNPMNPRTTNLHGHIIKFSEQGNSPLATTFRWEIFLLAGDPSLAAGGSNLTGNINGDTFSSPDGIAIDPQGRLWVQTDHSVPGNSGVSGRSIDQAFGHNAMFHVDQVTKLSKRFLVGPLGCEITGLTYTPDLRTFFVNIQHPTGNWPVAGQQPRSSTIVVRRTDNQPVGA